MRAEEWFREWTSCAQSSQLGKSRSYSNLEFVTQLGGCLLGIRHSPERFHLERREALVVFIDCQGAR